MTHRLAETARLTDFCNGRLEVAATGNSVTDTPLHRAIAAHFADAADWADFADQGQAAQAAFARMQEVGLLVPVPAPKSQAWHHLVRPEITLFEVPHRALQDISAGEIVILGAPIDIGTTAYPGARYGPQAIRSASVERYQCKLDLQTGSMIGWNVPALGGGILAGARISDAGDLPYVPGEPAEAYYLRLRQIVDHIYAAGAFPIVLGGDHSITYSTCPPDPAALIHLDAHCDLAERIPGHCHHHGNVLRRLLDEGRITEVHHYGLRDTAGWDTVNAGTFAKAVGDLDQDGWDAEIAGKRVFVSLDVDVLDPTILPGTGTPVVGGLSLRKLCQVLARITAITRPAGLDIVELCPIRDDSGVSERQVVEVLLCFLAVHHSTT